jgi:hypothetical protein
MPKTEILVDSSPVPAQNNLMSTDTLSSKSAHASRREFITGIVAASGCLALAGERVFAQDKGPCRIDVHHHFIPDAYFAYQQKYDLARANPWSLNKDLDDMDKFGTQTAILSITYPAFSKGEPDEIRNIARACNEAAAKLAADKPEVLDDSIDVPTGYERRGWFDDRPRLAYELLQPACGQLAINLGVEILPSQQLCGVVVALHRRVAKGRASGRIRWQPHLGR